MCMGDAVSIQTRVKKPTNVSLDQSLIEDAKALGINISQAAESGLREAVAAERSELWRRENAKAIESANAWVEKNGLPLAKYRQF